MARQTAATVAAEPVFEVNVLPVTSSDVVGALPSTKKHFRLPEAVVNDQ